MTENSKDCPKCLLTKTTDDFHKQKSRSDGLQSVCKLCQKQAHSARRLLQPEAYAARQKRWRKNNPTSAAALDRRHQLKKRYGLTEEAFDALLRQQGGACALCGTDEPKGHGQWHVDHDHSTGRVRSLLCLHCNVGIGALKDSPNLLRAAARYIEHHKERNEETDSTPDYP